MEQQYLNDMRKLADAFFDYLQRGGCEYGGWGLDDKRPFGSSSVEASILDILGATPEDHGYYSDEQHNYANALYANLGIFLRNQWQQYRELMERGLQS